MVVFRQRFALTLLGIATVAVIGLAGRRLAVTLARRARRTIGRADGRSGSASWRPQSPRYTRTSGSTIRSSCRSRSRSSWCRSALLVAIGAPRHIRPCSREFFSACSLGLAALTRSEIVLLHPGIRGYCRPSLCRRRSRQLWPAAGARCRRRGDDDCHGASTTSRGSTSRFFLAPTTARRCSAPTATSRTTTISVAGISSASAQLEPGWAHPVLPDASERSADRRERAIDYIYRSHRRVPLIVMARLGQAPRRLWSVVTGRPRRGRGEG